MAANLARLGWYNYRDLFVETYMKEEFELKGMAGFPGEPFFGAVRGMLEK